MVLSIGLDEKTTSDLWHLAKVRNIEPDALAQEAIRAFLQSEAERAMDREIDAFRRLHDKLLATIPHQYAAIHRGQLVNYDSDQLALFERVEQRFPGLPVLIRLVEIEPDPTITVRTPKID